TLTFGINFGVTATGSGTATLQLVGSVDRINRTLNTLFYQPSTTGSAVITVSKGQTVVDTRTLLVEANHVNAVPRVNVPSGAQSVTPEVAFALNDSAGNTVSVGDLDSGFAQVEVQLRVTTGTLRLGTTVGLTFVNGTTNNSSLITVRGRVDH